MAYPSALIRSPALIDWYQPSVSMELMRHLTPEMTSATYAQTIGDEKRNAGEDSLSGVGKEQSSLATEWPFTGPIQLSAVLLAQISDLYV